MINERELAKIDSLSGLTLEDLKSLSHEFEELHLSPDNVLIHEGREASGAFLVLEGHVEVEKLLPGEMERLLVSKVSIGDWVGVVSLIDNKPATATVRAISASRVLAISRLTFSRFVDGDRPVGIRFHRALLRSVAIQLGRVNQNVLSLRAAASER
jgi:CRP/FNR family transcriptional regulator, cyclic AMP receptor protein